MNRRDIFRKSSKAVEALGARERDLAGKLRTLLILVDGKRNVEELIKLSQGLGESEQLLLQLQSEGWIEVVSAPEAAQPPAATVTGAVTEISESPAAQRRTLDQVRNLAVRRMTEALGPSADDICLKIEAAKDVTQFVDVVKRAYAMVREARGAAAAERFGQEIEDHMPPAG
jgi:hypothetical protein